MDDTRDTYLLTVLLAWVADAPREDLRALQPLTDDEDDA